MRVALKHKRKYEEENKEVLRCWTCGAVIPDGLLFCPSCGSYYM